MRAASTSRGTAGGVAGRGRQRFDAYLELTKPRITLLMLITCMAAAMLAPSSDAFGALAALVTAVGLACSTGGASALNHAFDRDIDARMQRTTMRPVVAGLVSVRAATVFGIVLMVVGGAMLAAFVNVLAAVLALAGGGFYVLVYTMWLKRTTVHNTVIGGVAGSVPPLVGWAAATGSLDAALPWELFAIMFAWQPAHFWALALLIRDDYARAGIPMLPVVSGERVTVAATWRWTWYTVLVSLLPVATGDAGVTYLVVAIVANAWLVRKVVVLRRAMAEVPAGELLVGASGTGRAAARGAFLASLAWLAVVFVALVVDVALLHVALW